MLPFEFRRLFFQLFIKYVGKIREYSWPAPASLALKEPGPLVVTGFMSEVLGVGRAAQLTATALRNQFPNIVSHDLRPAFRHLISADLTLPGGPGGVWVLNANAPECLLALQAHRPSSWRDRYRIGYWAWETTLAPGNWTSAADFFHEIWTPSRFSADALAASFTLEHRSDLIAKLKVMPHPASSVSQSPDRMQFGLSEDAVVTLISFDGRSSYTRKNPEGALRAWLEAFPSIESGRQLVIKAIEEQFDAAHWRRLVSLAEARPDVILIARELDNESMETLMASIDIVLSLARAEGFGLSLAEAMAHGKVVITTNYAAAPEYMDNSCAVLVECVEVPVVDPTGVYQTGRWADPDLNSAVEALRRVHENSELRAKLGAAARERVKLLNQPWSKDSLEQAEWFNLVST